MKKNKARTALIKARKDKKMTQQEVADAVSINRAFLANIERGEHTPSLEVAHKIALVLDSDMETLFFNKNVRITHSA